MQTPTEEILQLKDGVATLEAKSLDDLAVQLCQRCPGEGYERTLHSKRDHQAEKLRADAMNRVIEILVDAVVKELGPE